MGSTAPGSSMAGENSQMQSNSALNLVRLNDEKPPYHHNGAFCSDGGHDGDRQVIGILDLPFDIMYLIFDNFRATEGRETCEDDRKTCRASRVVCRRFCTLATPLLFESLTIDLDVESMRRAETLVTQNPVIAASVRTVVVSLACRDPAQAQDLPTFLEARRTELGGMLGCYGQWDTSIYAIDKERRGKEFGVMEYQDMCCSESPWEDPDGIPPEEFEAFRNWHRIKHALDDFEEECTLRMTRENDMDGNQGDGPVTEEPIPWSAEREIAVRTYRQLTMDAYTVYGQKCQEQLHSIESGSFARTIARCLAKMRHERLQLVMTHEPEFDLLSGKKKACYYINNNERLLWAMSSPHYWRDVRDAWSHRYDPDRPERRPPAIRLLAEIPVACYQAGAPVSHLKLACSPLATGFSELFPFSNALPSMREWSAELRAACQQLQSFHMEDCICCCASSSLIERASKHVDTYLSAILSGGKLESITVRMFPYDLGNVLPMAAASWRHVHSLELNGPYLGQKNMETMFRNLAGGALMDYLILSIQLLGGHGGRGSWANALDILRETLMGRYGDELASRSSLFLGGGELQSIYAEAEQHNPYRDEHPYPEDWDSDFDSLESLWEENLMNLVLCYVSGDARVNENPLRGDREALYERITRPTMRLLLP